MVLLVLLVLFYAKSPIWPIEMNKQTDERTEWTIESVRQRENKVHTQHPALCELRSKFFFLSFYSFTFSTTHTFCIWLLVFVCYNFYIKSTIFFFFRQFFFLAFVLNLNTMNLIATANTELRQMNFLERFHYFIYRHCH